MDGTTQEVVIKWRDALEVIHQHMLSATYDPAVDLQLEPDITPELCHQKFDDCSNSMLYYLMDSYLSDGQCVMLYDLSSDGSQCGDGRQDFWSVTTTPCIYRKHRRQMLDCKLLVGQLPRVVGADEKAHMYQHAIRRIFQSMNAAGRHGVRMYFRGARKPCVCLVPLRMGNGIACRARWRSRSTHDVSVAALYPNRPPRALHRCRHLTGVRTELSVLRMLDAQGFLG